MLRNRCAVSGLQIFAEAFGPDFIGRRTPAAAAPPALSGSPPALHTLKRFARTFRGPLRKLKLARCQHLGQILQPWIFELWWRAGTWRTRTVRLWIAQDTQYLKFFFFDVNLIEFRSDIG